MANACPPPINLTTFGPDLNPFELRWSDLKRSLRILAINDQDQLRRGVLRVQRRVPILGTAGGVRPALRYTQVNRSRR